LVLETLIATVLTLDMFLQQLLALPEKRMFFENNGNPLYFSKLFSFVNRNEKYLHYAIRIVETGCSKQG
jgi:hypothetical protein